MPLSISGNAWGRRVDTDRVWVVPADAVAALAAHHKRTGRYSNMATCIQVAESTLIDRLAFARAQSYADHVVMDSDGYGEEETFEKGFVPEYFWGSWSGLDVIERTADWVAGDFRYRSANSYGAAFAVRFDANTLPVPLANIAEPLEVAQLGAGKPKGRPIANWWPEFAEELAVYVNDHGLPEAQDSLISAVQQAVTAKGKAEPSRSAIQPVIRALYARIGPAKK